MYGVGKAIAAKLGSCRTLLWNGPLGVYELGPFGGGTIAAFWDLVSATAAGATTIIGGGDTGSASKFFYATIPTRSTSCVPVKSSAL